MFKRISIATLGLGLIGTQACVSGDVDQGSENIEGVSQELACYTNDGVNPMLASLAVAMAKGIGEINAVRDLKIENGWVKLSTTGRNKCNATGGCKNIDAILDMQNDAVNSVLPTNVFNATNYRNTLVASYERQKNWEQNLANNDPGALPEPHRLVFSHEFDNGGCDTHFVFDALKANCSGGAAAFNESNGMVVMEAEHFHGKSSNGSWDNWNTVWDGGASGGQMMQVGPDDNHYWTSNISSTAPSLTFNVKFSQTGTYYMYVRGKSPYNHGGSDSVHGGIDGQAPSNLQNFDFPQDGNLGWIGKTLSVNSTGTHTIHLFAREDGFYADKIVLQKWSGAPWGSGPSESSQSSGSCNMDNPNDIVNRLAFFENGGNDFLAFYATESEVAIDPTGTMVEGAESDSGSCVLANQAYSDDGSINGTCCQRTNGVYGTFQKSSFNPTLYLCKAN